MNPIVSVIMPAHNSSKFIKASIDSVLNQSLQNIELIIVDDFSTDDTKEIIDKYSSRDIRVRPEYLREQKGVSAARNVGISKACGRFIAFLDSDDLWMASKLEQQVAYMTAHNVDFTYCGYEIINDQGYAVGERRITESKLNHNQLLKGNRIGLLSVMLTRQLASDHPFPDIHHEDYGCWLSILRAGQVAYRFSPELLCRYRKHKTSLSSNKLKAASWTWHIFRSFEKLNIFQSMYYFLFYVYMALTDKR